MKNDLQPVKLPRQDVPDGEYNLDPLFRKENGKSENQVDQSTKKEGCLSAFRQEEVEISMQRQEKGHCELCPPTSSQVLPSCACCNQRRRRPTYHDTMKKR